MGTDRHHAIVVTYWDKARVEQVHRFAQSIGLADICTPIFDSRINSFYTFVITPDGSKEYWDDSDKCDELRAKFIDFVKTEHSCVNVVCISYGGDLGRAVIEHDSKADEEG